MSRIFLAFFLFVVAGSAIQGDPLSERERLARYRENEARQAREAHQAYESWYNTNVRGQSHVVGQCGNAVSSVASSSGEVWRRVDTRGTVEPGVDYPRQREWDGNARIWRETLTPRAWIGGQYVDYGPGGD